jgi:hypothetical protein
MKSGEDHKDLSDNRELLYIIIQIKSFLDHFDEVHMVEREVL